MGGGDSHGEQSYTTQEGSPQSSRVDCKLPSVVSKTTVTPSPPTLLSLSYLNYSPYSHNARDILFDPANILNVQKLLILHHERNKGKDRFIPYAVGQKVWLEGTNLWLAQPSSKLEPRQYGPFTILKVISLVVYWLELPPSWKMFPTFHASLLSPY